MIALSVLMVVLILLRPRLTALVEGHDALAAWSKVFVLMGLQSLPFLVPVVVLSAAIAVLVPADALTRRLPRRPAVAVPVAGLSPGWFCRL